MKYKVTTTHFEFWALYSVKPSSRNSYWIAGNGPEKFFWIKNKIEYIVVEYQFDQLPKMGYKCIGIDTRGFSNSDKPWRGYDFNRLSDDVRCVIEALGLHDITLAGHSNGGAIAIRYGST